MSWLAALLTPRPEAAAMAAAPAAALPMARAQGRRLMLLTNGSRGDVQPFVALGMALQKAGFTVVLSTNMNHVGFVRSMGLEVVGTNPDSEQWLKEDPRMIECIAKGSVMECVRSVADFNARNFPDVLARKIEAIDAWRPDVILTTVLDWWEASAIGGSRGIPVVMAGLQSMFPTNEQKTMFGEPDWFPHRALGTAFMYLFWKTDRNTKGPIIREQLPEAEPFITSSFHQFMYTFFHPTAPCLIGFSPSLQRIPADWPEDLKQRVKVTGFWAVPKDEQEARLRAGDSMFGGGARAELEAFLAAGGGTPVYMGWGSMLAVSAEHMALLAVRSLMKTGMRGIILGGWANLEPGLLAGQPDSEAMEAYARERVLFVKTAPHEWLFPQCACTVHHGGSGTTAAALRSGVPTVVTPCAFDQFDNARMAVAGGTGIALRQFSRVTVSDLAAAVKRCTTDADMLRSAKELAGKLRAEDGTAEAVRAIDDFIADELDTGAWKANFEVHLQTMKRLKAHRPPSCLAWFARVFCSSSPNDYSVKPEKSAAKREQGAVVLLGREQLSGFERKGAAAKA